jgi:hypothetical protein
MSDKIDRHSRPDGTRQTDYAAIVTHHMHPVYDASCRAVEDNENSYCTNDKDVDCPACLRGLKVSATKYIFPRSKFVDKNGIFNQIEHIDSELKELLDAFFHEPTQRIAEECRDLLHSVETLSRILMEFSDIDISATDKAIIQKNKDRGYYAP